MVDIITVSLSLGNLIGIILYSFAVILAYSVWKNNENPMDLWIFFIYLVSTLIVVNGEILSYLEIFGIIELDYIPKLGFLSVFGFLSILIASLYLWFLLYLVGWKKLFSLPIAIAFYLSFYLIETDNENFTRLFIIATLLSSLIVFIINSIKNKSGLSFSLTVLGTLGIVTSVIPFSAFAMIIVRWIIAINLILGMNGWYDDHVFYDRKKRKQIQNVWIAKMTTV